MTETIEVWGDVRCPWCWIGHRRLARAHERVGEHVAVSYRAFLLEPQGPGRTGGTVAEAAVADWGMSPRRWARHRDRIRAAGDELGLDIRMDTTPVVDSRPAHRLLALARRRGVDERGAREAVFDALLRRNRDVSDPAVLRELGAASGVDPDEVEALLTTDAFAAEVRVDHAEAVRRGVRAVPALVTPRGRLEGDRSVDELVDVLRAPAGAGR